jgi:predicted nucleic acid-binding protein
MRLLRLHPLQTADALQLAAALVAAEDDPTSQEFLTLDDRLKKAAQLHGFRDPVMDDAAEGE